jgi:hypothetical protein
MRDKVFTAVKYEVWSSVSKRCLVLQAVTNFSEENIASILRVGIWRHFIFSKVGNHIRIYKSEDYGPWNRLHAQFIQTKVTRY